MNAAQHLAKAQQILNDIDYGQETIEVESRIGLALEAIGHGLAALAIEMGVPTATPARGVTAGGDTKPAAQQR